MTTLAPRSRPRLGGSSSIAVAMAVMNVATYGYTIVAARLLGPQAYGGFAAAMGLLLILSVLQLGLQATGARRVASSPDQIGTIERALVTVSNRTAVVVTVLALVLTPVINAALDLDSALSAILVALTVLPMTLVGGQAGVLQGERRWRALAVLYAAAGIPRFVVGTALLLAQPSETLAILGVAIGWVPPALVGWLALRRSAATREPVRTREHGKRALSWETVRNSHALLAFFALSNADVLLSRTFLDRHESGLYAGGVILVKAMLFLPQFVVVIAFPAMSDRAQRRDALVRSVVGVLGIGVVGAAATWLLSGWQVFGTAGDRVSLPVLFIGGPEYADIARQLWLFAVIGTLLSLLQLLVYSVVARQSQWSVYLIWGSLALLTLTATQVSTVLGLALAVCGVDGSLFLLLLAISLWRLRTAPVENLVAEAAVG